MDPRTLLASLKNGRASIDERGGLKLAAAGGSELAERLRRAYAWVTSTRWCVRIRISTWAIR